MAQFPMEDIRELTLGDPFPGYTDLGREIIDGWRWGNIVRQAFKFDGQLYVFEYRDGNSESPWFWWDDEGDYVECHPASAVEVTRIEYRRTDVQVPCA